MPDGKAGEKESGVGKHHLARGMGDLGAVGMRHFRVVYHRAMTDLSSKPKLGILCIRKYSAMVHIISLTVVAK